MDAYQLDRVISTFRTWSTMAGAGATLLALFVGVFTPSTAFAVSQQYHQPQETMDLEDVRSAVRRGDAVSLATVMRWAVPTLTGELAGVKLERYEGVLHYEFRVISPSGHMQYLHFSAAPRKSRPRLQPQNLQ